jgi:hypothetical protein
MRPRNSLLAVLALLALTGVAGCGDDSDDKDGTAAKQVTVKTGAPTPDFKQRVTAICEESNKEMKATRDAEVAGKLKSAGEQARRLQESVDKRREQLSELIPPPQQREAYTRYLNLLGQLSAAYAAETKALEADGGTGDLTPEQEKAIQAATDREFDVLSVTTDLGIERCEIVQ